MMDEANIKVSGPPPQFDEMMSILARQQLGLDARYTVYAVATDHIDEIELDSIDSFEDLHLQSFTVHLPAGLARVSLAPYEDGVWNLKEAVHGVVNLGHDAREALAAGSSRHRPQVALPPRGGRH